jgi:ketosteroid isomerase-like protein
VSEKNMEILRGGFEWLPVSGTFPVHLVTPDVVWDTSTFRGGLEQQVYEGVPGVEEFFAEWGSAWDDWQIEIEALYDASDKVVAVVRQRGRSKLNGILVEMSFAQVWTFRDGLATRMEMYADPDEALKAAGLEP